MNIFEGISAWYAGIKKKRANTILNTNIAEIEDKYKIVENKGEMYIFCGSEVVCKLDYSMTVSEITSKLDLIRHDALDYKGLIKENK